VLTTGKRYILFYPNPTNRAAAINHLLQQGIGTDARLVFYDMTGRMIKNYPSIPDRIDLSLMPAGIILYKLFSNKNELLETGKLLLQ
jgi:hypothetical protein